jgi:hypothetical protein
MEKPMQLVAKSMGRALAVFLFLNVAGLDAAFAQTSAAKGEPTIKALVENDSVKAYLVTFAPGEALPSLDRPRRLVHYQSAGTLQRVYPDGKAEDRTFNMGDTAWIEPAAYAIKNIGATTVVVFVVEVK